MDRAVYSAVASFPHPSLDEPLARSPTPRITPASGWRSRLGWAWRGPDGSRATVRGTVAIGVTSALVNLAVKSALSRQRPDRPAPGSRSGGTCGCRPPRRSRPVTRHRGSPSPRPSAGTSPGSGWRCGSWPRRWGTPGAHRVHYPGDAVGLADRRGHWAGLAGLIDRLPPPEGPPDPVAVSGVSCPMPPIRKMHRADPPSTGGSRRSRPNTTLARVPPQRQHPARLTTQAQLSDAARLLRELPIARRR